MAWAPEKREEPNPRDFRAGRDDRGGARGGGGGRGGGSGGGGSRGKGGSGRGRSCYVEVFGPREPPLCFKLNNNMIGVVIGRGGSKIKDIQSTTSTKIQIMKGDSEAEVKIFGTKDMKAKAKAAIETLVKKQERSYTSESSVDNAGPQPFVGRDFHTDTTGRQVQPLIEWDQVRAEVVEW